MKAKEPAMPFHLSETNLELPFLTAAHEEECGSPSRLEEDVSGLFRQLRNPLLRYLLAFGLAEHDGEEVVQEVFLALFCHLQCGKSRQNLRGWVFRVAHNLGLKRRIAAQREQQEGTQSATQAADRQVDPSLDPEQQFARNQKQRRLLSVFKALPEQDQCCLALRAEGLRYREIAEVLNMSLGSISNSLTRSLARLERATKE